MTDELTMARADVEAIVAHVMRMSAHELAWWNAGAARLQGEIGRSTALLLYEPLTFNLPGGKYTPDFLHILSDGQLALVEVKAHKAQKGYRDARSKLRAAAELYPWALWYEARPDDHGYWTVEQITGGQRGRRQAGGGGAIAGRAGAAAGAAERGGAGEAGGD